MSRTLELAPERPSLRDIAAAEEAMRILITHCLIFLRERKERREAEETTNGPQA